MREHDQQGRVQALCGARHLPLCVSNSSSLLPATSYAGPCLISERKSRSSSSSHHGTSHGLARTMRALFIAVIYCCYSLLLFIAVIHCCDWVGGGNEAFGTMYVISSHQTFPFKKFLSTASPKTPPTCPGPKVFPTVSPTAR
jgi:hypothetical protein